MLGKREKRDVYIWYFINRLANHFSHLAFHRSRQAVVIFTKRRSKRMIRQVFHQFLAESNMNEIGDIMRSV